MIGLPVLPNADGIRKSTQINFGGYHHTAAAKDGQIWDMRNMTSDDAPLLSSRKKRYKVRQLSRPNGLYAHDGLYWVDGTDFYADGIRKGTVTDSKKQMVSLGAYVVIFPDKAYYNTATGVFGSLEVRWQGVVRIEDGTFAGVSAKANTIYAVGVNWNTFFKVGDAVEIAGAVQHTANNKTAVIREISGERLRFYENVFQIAGGGENETLTISRKVPDMDYLCENENRLWGCKGDTIYASKLGDVFNWNVFDGVATDSYAVTVGSAGDFTGCARFLGYPCFFKEDLIYKVYGSKPSNFQVMGSASLGIMAGSSRSVAIAAEKMFYLSRAGVAVYSGGIPQEIAGAFGDVHYKNGIGGSDGRKYYISMEEGNAAALFVYDPAKNVWHREDETAVISFAYHEGLYFLESGGGIFFVGGTGDVPLGAMPEEEVASMVEFADFEEGTPNKKGTSKLHMRMELAAGTSLTVFIQFDSDGVWHKVRECMAERKRSFYLPIIPQRSDHYKIKMEASGEWKLHSLAKENYIGSEL